MEERYIKNIDAITAEDCVRLQNCKVLVAGCGGLGGHIIDMLLRVGVGHISAADGDVFEPSNLNRQLLSAVDVIGESKANTAASYALRVNPEVCFTAYDTFISDDNAPAMLAGCEAVLDALDDVRTRRLLKAECDRQGIPYIYGAVNGWVAQAAVSMPGDRLLELLYSAEAPALVGGTLAFTPAVGAALQCSLCVKLLCGKPLESGRLYLLDLSELDFVKLF